MFNVPITPERIKHALCAAGMPENWAKDVEMALCAVEGNWNNDQHNATIGFALRICPEIQQLLEGIQTSAQEQQQPIDAQVVPDSTSLTRAAQPGTASPLSRWFNS